MTVTADLYALQNQCLVNHPLLVSNARIRDALDPKVPLDTHITRTELRRPGLTAAQMTPLTDYGYLTITARYQIIIDPIYI